MTRHIYGHQPDMRHYRFIRESGLPYGYFTLNRWCYARPAVRWAAWIASGAALALAAVRVWA